MVAVTVVGYGNNKNDWNGYAEVQLCTRVAAEEAPVVEVETLSSNMVNVELPFPTGRKGFNVVNRCAFVVTTNGEGVGRTKGVRRACRACRARRQTDLSRTVE